MERNNSNNIDSNFFIFGEGEDSKFLIHSSIMDKILRDSNFPSLPDCIKYNYLCNFLTQVAKKGFNDCFKKNGDSPIPPLIYRDWSDYCVLNSSLKKKGSEDYFLLLGLSILSIEEHAENVNKDKVFEKYNFLRSSWENQMDMILNEMRQKEVTYFIYQVRDNPHPNIRTELSIKGNIPPVDFFDKDVCKIIINPSKFEIGTQANEVVRHILCRDSTEQDERLSRIPDSLKPQRNGHLDKTKFAEKLKNVLKDAEIRIKRNPRLAIPYGLNLKLQDMENTNKRIRVKGQFAIPLYETCDDTTPFGGLTVTTQISGPRVDYLLNKKNRVAEQSGQTEEDRIISDAIEFSVCTYIFKTILTKEQILLNVLPYVNCDINYLWCNNPEEREQEE